MSQSCVVGSICQETAEVLHESESAELYCGAKRCPEIQGVIKFANEHLIPVVQLVCGASILEQGGIMLNVTRIVPCKCL